MQKKAVHLSLIDRFARRQPRLMEVVIGVLMIVVVLVELTTTDAPLVLYQAF